MGYQISYDHGPHGANEITNIESLDELKKAIKSAEEEGHTDIKIWEDVTEKLSHLLNKVKK